MLTLRVWNLSGLAPVSDYAYDVHVGDQRIASGSVSGHTRADGWAVLVKKIVDEHIAAGFTGARARDIACGKKSPRSNRICVALDTPGHTCKFVKIVPAKQPGVKR
jgi:hypothetical protein